MATVVQSTDGGATCSSPVNTTFTSSVTAGNHIIVVVTTDSTAVASVSDNKSNTYTQNVTVYNGESISIFSAKAVTGGATFTVSYTAATCSGVTLYEVSGLDGTTWFDTSATGSGTSTTPATASLTAAGAGILIAGVGVGGSTTITGPGAPWTQHGFENESFSTMTINAQSQTNGSSGSYSCSWTLGASNRWVAAIAAYKDGTVGTKPSFRVRPTRPAAFRPGLAR